jgi:hypothetical protein
MPVIRQVPLLLACQIPGVIEPSLFGFPAGALKSSFLQKALAYLIVPVGHSATPY